MRVVDGVAMVPGFDSHLAAKPTTKTPIALGIMSGIVCLVVFLTIHAIWIVPIWNVALIGVFIAGGGGALSARCCLVVHRLMPVRPLSWFVIFGMVAIPLAPCIILATVLPPLLESENGQIVHPINVPWLVGGFFVNLLIPAAVVGAAMGWRIARRRSAVALFAGMGLLMAVGPGHNLPLFGLFSGATGPQLFKAIVLTFVPMAVAAVVLWETINWFARNRIQSAGETGERSQGQPNMSGANKSV